MGDLNRAELREAMRDMSDDLKEFVRDQTNHVESRLGTRIDGINARLDQLNSKTATHAAEIARMQEAQKNLGKEVFNRRSSDRQPSSVATDIARGPTWQQVGLGLSAMIGIGYGAWSGLQAIAGFFRFLGRVQ